MGKKIKLFNFYQNELGIYEYCCSLGMKVFEPATVDEFKNYHYLSECKKNKKF
jgi:hypothetical protein